LWTPRDRHTFWASIARAVRTPSRADEDGRLVNSVLAPGEAPNISPLPLVASIFGNRDLESERLTAYEAGYRVQPSDDLNLDIAAYYNDYSHLRTGMVEPAFCSPSGQPVPGCLFLPPSPTHLVAPIRVGSQGEGSVHGLELAADWRLSRQFQLRGSYSFSQMDLRAPANTDSGYTEGENPVHQVSLRGSYSPRSDLDLDLWLRYVDQLTGFIGDRDLTVDQYLTMDLRVAWRPSRDLELSLVGQNLLDNGHAEFYSELRDVPLTGVERSVYGQIRWEF